MLLKFKCITVLAFLIVRCYDLSLSAKLNIERGERDVFDNPNCDSPTGVGCNCGLNANCVDSTCKRCICSPTHGTFLPSNDSNGQCVKNRGLLFIPASSNSFLVQKTECIKPSLYKGVYYVRKTVCDETDHTQRWVWTQNNQLMNVALWICLEQGVPYSASGYWYLILKTCSNRIKQLWSCQEQTFSLKTPTLYMNSREDTLYVLGTSDFNERDLWTRYLSRENLCAKGSCNVKTTMGECCVFPFQYKKKQYYSCTTIDNKKTPWCATTNNYDSDSDTNEWGNCNEALSSSFLVQSNKCMIPYKDSLIERPCYFNDSSQHWIWTPNNQLLHVDTSKCLQLGPQSSLNRNYWALVLEECKSTETKQLWKCQGQGGKTFSLKNDDMVNLFIGFDRAWGTISTLYRQAWDRYQSGKYLCSKAYGCYEFVNSSPAVLLIAELRKCPQQCFEEREISVPHKSTETLCFVMWEKLQYLDNDQWTQLPFTNEVFIVDKRNNRTFLQLNFTKATNRWIGLIVKLYFYCSEKKLSQVNTTDIKCVVVKFKETYIYPPTVTPTITVLAFNTSSTEQISNSTSAPERRKSDSSNAVIIIVVCVVIAILILCGILGFIVYKRRRCSAESKEDDSPIAQSSGNTLNIIYSSVDDNPTSSLPSGGEATYEEAQSGTSRECELYEPGDVHIYQYTDAKENDKHLPLQENEYEYAETGAETGGENRGKESTGKDEKGQSESSHYETLEDPNEHVSLKV